MEKCELKYLSVGDEFRCVPGGAVYTVNDLVVPGWIVATGGNIMYLHFRPYKLIYSLKSVEIPVKQLTCNSCVIVNILILTLKKSKMVTKGEMLDRIFNRMDELKLSDKMRKLFVKNNMDIADLTELKRRSESDYELWQKMYKRNQRLMALSAFTVLNK